MKVGDVEDGIWQPVPPTVSERGISDTTATGLTVPAKDSHPKPLWEQVDDP
jgi:hypothetical protein